MADRVFVTGAAGFVGTAVAEELVRRGYRVNALVRRNQTSSETPESRQGETRIFGDLFDPKSLDDGLRDCSVAIHLVGIIMEKPSAGVTFERIHFQGTKAVVDAAKRAGVRRYIHMSALGARPDAASDYHKTKWQAEESVRASGLDWTIIRPSMIHGPRGAFIRQAAAWARKKAMPFLFMPYFGRGLLGFGGAGLVQPVFVGDVARAFVDAIEKPQTIGKTYDFGGPDRMTWPQMYKIIANAVVGKKRLTLPIPAWYAKLLTHIAPRALLPFNRDQVIMSQEDNVAGIGPFVADIGWTPHGFEQTLVKYAARLGKEQTTNQHK